MQTSNKTTSPTQASRRILLPTNVTPTYYDLLLQARADCKLAVCSRYTPRKSIFFSHPNITNLPQPDLEAFTFSGKSSTRLSVNKSTSTIVLHANEVSSSSRQTLQAHFDAISRCAMHIFKRRDIMVGFILLLR